MRFIVSHISESRCGAPGHLPVKCESSLPGPQERGTGGTLYLIMGRGTRATRPGAVFGV